MMMKANIKKIISEISGLPESAITENAHLSRDLNIDSLDFVDLVLHMEDTFHLSIPDQDYPQLDTVSKIMIYLESKTIEIEPMK
jgi:acyl carrier protein